MMRKKNARRSTPRPARKAAKKKAVKKTAAGRAKKQRTGKTAKKTTQRKVKTVKRPASATKTRPRPAARATGVRSRKAIKAATGSVVTEPEILRASLLELIRKTSAELPDDVVRAIETGRSKEAPDSNALWAMDVIGENIDLASAKSQPLCQDTGTIIFFVKAPRGFDEEVFGRAAEAAVVTATEKGYLRQNSVDSLTGRNTGNNLGPGSPVIHLHQWKKSKIDVRLMLKGGGCENVGAQYSLPDGRVGAGRDLKGVEKCILDAVHQAQGKGCGPGVLGVTIGGDRATGFVESKAQLLRVLDDRNTNPELAALEDRVVRKANELGIGPMGFGGTTTLLGCKIGALNRLPASFFVSVSYMCWAYRRQGAELSLQGAIQRWLY